MAKYYLAHAGLKGYLPSYSTAHELSTYQERKLAKEMYLDLDIAKHGNEYCEIVEVDHQTYLEWDDSEYPQ